MQTECKSSVSTIKLYCHFVIFVSYRTVKRRAMCILDIVTITFLILHMTNLAYNTNVENSLLIEDLSESGTDKQSELWNERRSFYHDLPSECREGTGKSIIII